MSNNPYPKAPKLPGQGHRLNLVPAENNSAKCFCPVCGATWLHGRPWSHMLISPEDLAAKLGVSTQAITSRIRSGTIAAYLKPGGGRNVYLIPVYESERVEDIGVIATKLPAEDLGEVKP